MRYPAPWEEGAFDGGWFSSAGPFTVELTCRAYPEQYEVFLGDRQCGYIRLRSGELRCDVPECGGETVFSAILPDQACFFESRSDRERWLSLICAELAKRENVTYIHRSGDDLARLAMKAVREAIRETASRLPAEWLVPLCGYGEEFGCGREYACPDEIRACSYVSSLLFSFTEEADREKIEKTREIVSAVRKMGNRFFGLGCVAGRWICPQLCGMSGDYFARCLGDAIGRKPSDKEADEFARGWKADQDYRMRSGDALNYFSRSYSAFLLDIETEKEDISFWWGMDFREIIASGTIGEPWRMTDGEILDEMLKPARFALFENATPDRMRPKARL